jgi:hypothetical protein
MKLHAKVIVATWQSHVASRAFASAVGVCLNIELLKFVTSEDYQVVL